MLLLIAGTATVAGILLALSDLPGYLKANFVLVKHPEAIPALFADNDLDEIRLDVKFKHFSKIEQKRKEALERDLLISSDADFVPGKISSTKQSFDCKLRLKGDLSDHWEGQKWSLRVRLKDGGAILGMSSFSLQNPVTRGYTSEWLYLESLRREDLLAVRYRFVNLTLNGKSMGIYALEEHFSKELVEAHKRREGIIVSFDEYRFWKTVPQIQGNLEWGSVYQSADLQARSSKRIELSPALQKQKVAAFNLLRGLQEKKLKGDEVFAPDRLGRFLAISRLWNAEHGFLMFNVDFYFDPITSRLEPIGRDGNPGGLLENVYCYFSGNWHPGVPDNWVNQALRSPRIAKAYVKHLERVTRPSYLAMLQDQFKAEELHLRRILLKDLFLEDDALIWKSDGGLLTYDPWALLRNRAKRIRDELTEGRPAMVYARPSKENPSDLEIVVRNALTQPIEIIGFEKDGRRWTAKETLSNPGISQLDPTGKNIVMPLQRFGHTSFDGDYLFTLPSYLEQNSTQNPKLPIENLYIILRILGMDLETHRLPIPIDPSRFEPEKLPFGKHTNIISRPSFLHEDGDTIYVAPGNHEVTEDLIIPPNRSLRLSPGTILRFGPKATLVSEGPILALGTENVPITLTAAKSTWPGLLIANANGRSELRHVRISKTAGIGHEANPKGIDRGGWTLTGGVTFYHSPVDISHCKISDALAEDSLNIIASDFTLGHSVFSDVSSDAFDGDFVRGAITNCTFERIGGDAIDFSGSNVKIEKVRVYATADKAISAGEGSQVIASDCKFEEVGYGIASKDLSEVRADNLQMVKARVAALAAYQKKSLFGPSTIIAHGIKVTETSNHYLIQKGSSATIDGKNVEGIELNVDSLYHEKSSPK